MITKTTPLYDTIALEIELPTSKTAGGIMIPERSQSPTYKGIIVAVGSKVKEAQVGEYIQHKKFAGVDFYMNGKLHKFIKEEDIIAIL